MNLRWVVAGAVALFLFASASAQAATMFGKEESIHYLQDIDVVSQENEPLFLGYKTTTQYLFAGLHIKDDGYVFGVRADHDKYIATTPEEIAKLQAGGLLPTPLPTYKLSALDYIIGYSLWIALPIIVIVYLVGWLRRRNAPAAPPPAAA